MSKARAKIILLSVQTINANNIANNNITKPDNTLFQVNQFPKFYEDTSIATNFDVYTHIPSNNLTLFDSIPIHTQPNTPENDPELETIVSYHQKGCQLYKATTNTAPMMCLVTH